MLRLWSQPPAAQRAGVLPLQHEPRRKRAECQGFYATVTWALDAHGTASIPTPPWKRGTSHRDSVEVEWGLLRHRRRPFRYLRAVLHAPALHGTDTQEAANTAALHGLTEALRPVIREHDPDGIHLSGDWNRRLDTAHGRELVRDAVTPLGLQLILPPKATHGFRAKIDASAVGRADLTAVTMLSREHFLDHRGYELTGAFCPPLPSGALHEPEDT
jgi:hypothetical protein